MDDAKLQQLKKWASGSDGEFYSLKCWVLDIIMAYERLIEKKGSCVPTWLPPVWKSFAGMVELDDGFQMFCAPDNSAFRNTETGIVVVLAYDGSVRFKGKMLFEYSGGAKK